MLIVGDRRRGAFHAHQHFPMAMAADTGGPKSVRREDPAERKVPRPMTTGRAPLPPRIPQAPAPLRANNNNPTQIGVAPPANGPTTAPVQDTTEAMNVVAQPVSVRPRPLEGAGVASPRDSISGQEEADTAVALPDHFKSALAEIAPASGPPMTKRMSDMPPSLGGQTVATTTPMASPMTAPLADPLGRPPGTVPLSPLRTPLPIAVVGGSSFRLQPKTPNGTTPLASPVAGSISVPSNALPSRDGYAPLSAASAAAATAFGPTPRASQSAIPPPPAALMAMTETLDLTPAPAKRPSAPAIPPPANATQFGPSITTTPPPVPPALASRPSNVPPAAGSNPTAFGPVPPARPSSRPSAGPSAPPPAPSSKPKPFGGVSEYERAMRRFSQPAIQEIDDHAPPPPDLSYQVYTPGTSARPSAKSLAEIDVVPKTSLALRVVLVLLGLCVVFGTAAAVIAVSSDDAPKPAAPAASTAAVAPPPVVSTPAPIVEPPPAASPPPVVAADPPADPTPTGTPTPKPKPTGSNPPPPASLKNIAPPPNPYGNPTTRK